MTNTVNEILNSDKNLDELAYVTSVYLEGKTDWQVNKSLEMGFDIKKNKWIDNDFAKCCLEFTLDELAKPVPAGRMCGSGINIATRESLKQNYSTLL